MTQPPRFVPDYWKAAEAYRIGETSLGDYHLIYASDYIFHNLTNSGRAPSPALARAIEQLLKAGERHDATTLADMLEFGLPQAGLAEHLPIRGLSVEVEADPPGIVERGRPVTFRTVADCDRALQYRFRLRYFGPHLQCRYGEVPPPVIRDYEPAPSVSWEDTTIPGHYRVFAHARLPDSQFDLDAFATQDLRIV